MTEGFHLKIVNAASGEPKLDEVGLHINPLEFIAVIINLWLFLCLIKSSPRCQTGYILNLLSDNTSALSWMHFTAKTRNPLLQPLARFASALLIQARSYLTRVQPRHTPGAKNDEADALSRGWLESFEDVIKRCFRLKTCQICLHPRKLPSVLGFSSRGDCTNIDNMELDWTRGTSITIHSGSSRLDSLAYSKIVRRRHSKVDGRVLSVLRLIPSAHRQMCDNRSWLQ
jgi:hypothetical protein